MAGVALLERIWFTCRHQFSWPRRDDKGEYYQVCLHCGVKYRYDWSRMRRLERLQADMAESAAPKRPPRSCGTRSGWQPRERRLRWEVPVLYRAVGTKEWQEGMSANISRSGLLFSAAGEMESGTMVEIMLDLPVEICGRPATRGLCMATIVRATLKEQTTMLGASITDYTVVEQQAAV